MHVLWGFIYIYIHISGQISSRNVQELNICKAQQPIYS